MTMTDLVTVGNDPPADAATRGYALNHVALVVGDMQSMRHFYGDVLGMRHIVTTHITQDYDVTYMGYPVNGSDSQTGAEMLEDLRNRDGLVEFLHARGSTVSEGRHGRMGRFSHLGFVVPDVRAAESRIKAFGVTILKGVGADTIEAESDIAQWWNINAANASMAKANLNVVDWAMILVVLDPEGNVVEIVERP